MSCNLLYDQIICIAVHLRILNNTYLMWRRMLVPTIVRCALTAWESDFKVLPDWKVLADWCWEWLKPKGRGPKGTWAGALFHQITLLVGALLCFFQNIFGQFSSDFDGIWVYLGRFFKISGFLRIAVFFRKIKVFKGRAFQKQSQIWPTNEKTSGGLETCDQRGSATHAFTKDMNFWSI